MNASSKQFASSVTRRMASALIGRAVTINLGCATVEGVVSQVSFEAGLPKVIVGGTQYDLARVLTAAPRELAQPNANQVNRHAG